MLDPSSASASASASAATGARLSRSRSASMVTLRVPHITIEVDATTPQQKDLAAQQHHQSFVALSPTLSLPTPPTIQIVNDFSTSTYAPPPSHPVMSNGNRHYQNNKTALDTSSISSTNLGIPSALHRRASFIQNHSGAGIAGGTAHKRMRTHSTASVNFRPSSSQMNGDLQEDRDYIEQPFHTLRHQPSQALSAKSAAPLNFHDLSAIYMVVAARRDSYDNLLWQCPTLALTAQSFLFSIALDGETTHVARIIAMLLSIVITTCSLQLFTRQLAAEQADRQWLISFERRHGVPFEDTAFGENWDRYSSTLPEAAGFVKVLALTGSFPLWRNSLFVFLGAAITVLSISFIKPSLFEGGDSKRAGGG